MRYLPVLFALTTIVGLGFVYGCQKQESNQSPNVPASSDDQKTGQGDHHHGNHDHDKNGQSDVSDMQKMKDGIAGLTEEDQASVMKQHFCPVSDEMLGVMGEPMKVTVNGKDVWICCEGCKEDLLANPEKHLAKLKN